MYVCIHQFTKRVALNSMRLITTYIYMFVYTIQTIIANHKYALYIYVCICIYMYVNVGGGKDPKYPKAEIIYLCINTPYQHIHIHINTHMIHDIYTYTCAFFIYIYIYIYIHNTYIWFYLLF